MITDKKVIIKWRRLKLKWQVWHLEINIRKAEADVVGVARLFRFFITAMVCLQLVYQVMVVNVCCSFILLFKPFLL